MQNQNNTKAAVVHSKWPSLILRSFLTVRETAVCPLWLVYFCFQCLLLAYVWMCLECFFLYERGRGHLFSVVSVRLIGVGYTNAVRSMSTADWCVTPCSYCNNVVSNTVYASFTLNEIDMHFCNTPYTCMDVLVLSWLYTLDKWQLDDWKLDFYYMSRRQ